MYLLPSIDLRGGKVVRLTQGRYDQQTIYGDSPVEQANAISDGGATWLHVVDLDGARSGRLSHLSVIEQICQLGRLKVEVGGGVRSEGVIDRLLSCGVERVILGTAALENWSWFEGLMSNPTYRGRLVLGLDARDGKLAVSGWEQQLQTTAEEVAKRINEWPVAAIVYTDIGLDGMMQGPNLSATRSIAESTDVPVIASGGICRLDDLRALAQLPIAGAIVGRAIYEGAFTVEQAVALFERGQDPC